jgi:tripeptidyl-peptidase-1
MFTFTNLLSLLTVLDAVLASPVNTRTPYAVKETHAVPRKWQRKSRAPADSPISLQIGLKQGQFEELERHLYEGTSSKPVATIVTLQLHCSRWY